MQITSQPTNHCRIQYKFGRNTKFSKITSSAKRNKKISCGSEIQVISEKPEIKSGPDIFQFGFRSGPNISYQDLFTCFSYVRPRMDLEFSGVAARAVIDLFWTKQSCASNLLRL